MKLPKDMFNEKELKALKTAKIFIDFKLVKLPSKFASRNSRAFCGSLSIKESGSHDVITRRHTNGIITFRIR